MENEKNLEEIQEEVTAAEQAENAENAAPAEETAPVEEVAAPAEETAPAESAEAAEETPAEEAAEEEAASDETAETVEETPAEDKPAEEKKEEVSKAVAKAEKSQKQKKTSKKLSKKDSDQMVKSPSQLEQPKPIADEKAKDVFSFSLSRQKYSLNGVPFIYATKGDTYASIAEANNLFPKEILRINDLDAAEELLPGTIVYLQPKKKHTVKGLDKHIVETEGETLRAIAQRYAITLKSLCKMNNLPETHTLRPGDELLLRK